MALTLITPPEGEPVTAALVKAHARITQEIEDSLLTGVYIPAARQFVEDFTKRKLIAQSWEWRLDAFPSWLKVPIAPLRAVTNIKYLDSAGVLQTLASTEYIVDSKSEPGRITPAYGKSWPSTYPVMNAVIVTVEGGYGAAVDVPPAIKQGIYLMVAELDARREAAIVGTIITDVPFGIKAFLMPYVVHEHG